MKGYVDNVCNTVTWFDLVTELVNWYYKTSIAQEKGTNFYDSAGINLKLDLVQKANLSESDSKHRKSPKIWIVIVNMFNDYQITNLGLLNHY